MYSGPAAAHGFAALAAEGIPDTVVLLGPSHHALARSAAVSLAETWLTPLGAVPVDLDLGRALVGKTELVVADEQSHRWEHSLEVQLPFLQFAYSPQTPRICPICVRSHPLTDLRQLTRDVEELGLALAQATAGSNVVLIASTDFSHQVPQAEAQREDELCLDAILDLDPQRLLRTVAERNISMCGPVPVAIALSCCKASGAHVAELLRYYTSGDITGDLGAVVGYASLLVRRSGGEPK
jgi:hypothetical protein